MPNKYLRLDAGRIKELEAVDSSAGAADAGKITALDSTGRFDLTMMPVGIGPDTKEVAASENLAAGDLVNIFDNGGSIAVRKADASSEGKEAIGFVLDAVTSGANALIYLDGTVTGLSGLTPGARYYLDSATAGGITATALTTAGEISQYVGRAVAATELAFESSQAITIA